MKFKLRLFENNKSDVCGVPGGYGDIKPVLRRVFAGPDGPRLLRYLLYDWNFFSICTTPEQTAMRNYAAKFLNELGNVFDIAVSADIDVAEKK
jgi:hypothetical protein